MFDVALAIEALVPQAKYGGSTTSNSKQQYDSLRWEDVRKKPTWEELEAVVIPEPEVVPTLEQRLKSVEDKVKVIDTNVKGLKEAEVK
ncbi:MAG: hypothetical protein M0P69_01520 [Bacteroidales bacterium]|nr:hypothetical protein [Bacteroidales bacterium]